MSRLAKLTSILGVLFGCQYLLLPTAVLADSRQGAYQPGPAPVQPANRRPTEAEVDRLFAEALKLLRENHAFQARQLLEKAASLEPNSAAVHCNLGLAYQNSGNIDRAIQEFNEALRLKPAMPEATLNIAGCYQSLGQTAEAISWYEKYLKVSSDSAESKQIKDVIEALKATSQKPASDPSLPDYFLAITSEGTYRWPIERLPIRVFIDSGAGVKGFRESFRHDLLESFDAWTKASGNRLRYVLVPERTEADVVCDWTSNPAEVSEAGTQSERGMAHIFASHGDIRRGTVKILTKPTLDEGTLSNDDMKKACLHEVGHVVGMQGHSPNNHDVMFFTVDTATVWPVLSKRDKATIARLYESYPEASASPEPQQGGR